MEITSRFNRDDFEVWVDHFQYLDLGERHQSVQSGKSYIRGTFDPEQNAYIIDKIHIDPDMIQTDVKKELLHEAKLQANKRDKKLLRKKRVAMPKHEPRMRMEQYQQPEDRPMITTDNLRETVVDITNSLQNSLKEPEGPTPGDARWQVSGLSHSSWSINHPDIMINGDSPLTLRIKKLPDGGWGAFGMNRMTNLSDITVLAIKKTPPGGDDWDEKYTEVFCTKAAEYFQEQKANILALKQAMIPQNPPYTAQPQQQGGPGGEMGGGMGGMGGGMGGMMASRGSRRRKAAHVMTPQQAMIALQIEGTGKLEEDKINLRQVALKYHPDRTKSEYAKIPWKAYTVLKETFIDQNKPLPRTAQEAGQGAGIGGPETEIQVNQKVQAYVSEARNQAIRLQQSISTPGVQVSPNAAIRNINNLNEFVNGAAVTVQANLGTKDPKAQGLYLKLMRASNFLNMAAGVFSQAGPQITQQVLASAIKSLNGFIRTAQDALNSTTTKKSSRRASANLDNLRKAQRIARQIHRACGDQDWYLGVRVINDRDGIGLGVGAAEPPQRRLKGSVEGIPVVLEGPGARMVRAQEEGRRLRRLAAKVIEEMEPSDITGIRGPVFGELSRGEEDLLHQIDQSPGGISKDQIADRNLLRSLIQKGYLEYAPHNKVKTLGVAANRSAYRLSTHGHWQLAVRSATMRLAGRIAEEIGVGEELMEPEAEKALKHHQRLVKKVYTHIKNSKRLSGSVRYLARKLGINFNDLVRVIGQLIVEGKIEMTKKKKFKPLPEPYVPVPGMESRVSNYLQHRKMDPVRVFIDEEEVRGEDWLDIMEAKDWVEKKFGKQLWNKEIDGSIYARKKITPYVEKKFLIMSPREWRNPPATEKLDDEGRYSATNSVFGIDRGRSDKRVDQLLSTSVYQLNTDEHRDGDDAAVKRRDIRERPSKIMPDPTQPN